MDPALMKILASNLRRLAEDLERHAEQTQLIRPTNGHRPTSAHAPYTETAQELARREQMSLEDAEKFIALLNQPETAATKLMKIAEVSRELQLSHGKVYQMIASGELPSLTMGKSRRVIRAELDDWLAKGAR